MPRARMQTARVTGVNISKFLARQGDCRAGQEEMTPCEKSKSIAMRGSCLKPMAPRAAQNAIELEAKGELELARTWRHVEDAMKLMRGPHQS
jgi:hypothetical protein